MHLRHRLWPFDSRGRRELVHRRAWLGEVRRCTIELQPRLPGRSEFRRAYDRFAVVFHREERNIAGHSTMVRARHSSDVNRDLAKLSGSRVYLAVAGLGLVLNILF